MAYQSEIEKLEARFEEKPEQWFAALADAYRKNKDLDLALDILNTWLEKRPNYTSGHIVRGRVLVDRGDDPAARQAFERVLELDAENIIAIRSLGEIAERAGDMAAARNWLTRLLEVDPMNEEAEEALKRLEGAAPAATAPTAAAAPAPPAVGAVPVAAEPAPEPQGFEPTALDEPEPQPGVAEEEAPGGEDFAVERASRADLDTTVPFEGLAVEEGPDLGVLGGDAEPMDLGVDVETSTEAGLPDADRAMELETSMVPEEGAAPAGDDLGMMPIDDSLAWGTGERTSGSISAEEVQEAEGAHEESLVEAAGFIPGTEGEEIAPGTEFDPEESSPGADFDAAEPVETVAAEDEEVVGGDLELIMPEAVGEPAEAEAPAASGDEPVVTETMADLYAKQGHRTQALEIYRELLAARPADARLQAKIDALVEKPAPPARAKQRFSVAATGGQSAPEYLRSILGGTAAELVAQDETPIEETLAPEPDPTRPAGDDLSLGSVFGDGPGGRPSAAGGRSAGGSFSFDEFFGAEPEETGPADTPAGGGSPPADESDSDFKDWLKGLKT